MNNFPAITEAQRQELIDWAKGYIDAAERYTANNPADRSGKAYLELLQIALAAMTAKPVGVAERNIDTSREYYELISDSPDLHRMEVYTAAPVPVLRLPDEADTSNLPFAAMAWNACLAEVKRLNTQP